MIGNYAKFYGMLVVIEREEFGVATIRVLKTKNVLCTPLTSLTPVKLQPTKSDAR